MTHERSFEDLTQSSMREDLRGSYSRFSPQDLRLLLLGNLGCGKTSSADTILGELSSVSVSASKSCQLRHGSFEDRSVTLVEAPRWFWSGGKIEDSVKKETVRATALLAPGPHCILLLVPVNQFTEIEGRVPAELEEMFGKESLDHTLVLLTSGDYLMGRTVEEYLQKEHPGLRQVIECCRGRYHVINNRRQKDRNQVRELLEKVDSIVQKNGICHVKTIQDTEFEKRWKERKEEFIKSYISKNVEDRETVASAHMQNTETSRSSDTGDWYSSTLQRRTEKRDEIEGRVGLSRVSNGLQSTPAPKPDSYSEVHDDRQLNKTPSFRLNSDGALLYRPTLQKKIVSTFHHRISSFEEQSPVASPTSSLHSPVFSYSPSSPTFAASPSSYPSSYSPSLATSPSPLLSSSPSPELRVVLLGRSGAGKSAAGNNILGREEFESRVITQECEKKKALVGGRRVAVVDTPDWFNSESAPDEVRAQISSCVALSSPGPHAFLLCVPLDQPAKLELQALWALDTVFGPEAVRKHTLVLFTCADRLRESGKAGKNGVEAYIASKRRDLSNLVEKCGDRFHVMETGEGGSERRTVVELLEKVEQMVKEAGGQCYSCPAFQEAENRVRQRQVEIARERKQKEEDRMGDVGQLPSKKRYSYMQTVAEAEEEVREDDIEKTRDEAEMSVSAMDNESLPPITPSSLRPSVLRSVMDKMQSSAKMLPKLLADSSEWVRDGAKQVKHSQVVGVVGSGAQNFQKMVVESSLWEKVGDRVPRVLVDGSAWVGSGAKAVAASPMWEKVGSGAKLVAGGSMRVGAGIGNGAKSLAQSPVWKKMGSGAKAGAKMVAESSAWERVGNTAKQVPKVVIGGALVGLVFGVFLWGVIGGAIGAAAGSAVTEVGRRKYSDKRRSNNTDEAAKYAARTVNDGRRDLAKQGDKLLKTE